MAAVRDLPYHRYADQLSGSAANPDHDGTDQPCGTYGA
jgi:hypothetical protein